MRNASMRVLGATPHLIRTFGSAHRAALRSIDHPWGSRVHHPSPSWYLMKSRLDQRRSIPFSHDGMVILVLLQNRCPFHNDLSMMVSGNVAQWLRWEREWELNVSPTVS